jgi:4-hydroxybenzoyl-CoA reductase subunit beta
MNKDGVCYSTYSGDVAPALLVLDAQVRIQGPGGVREVALADLYSGEGAAPLTLAPADLLTAVIIPASSAGPSAYKKHALRGAIDFPQVGAAVWRGDGAPRVAFTAVDRAPQRASALEAALAGSPFTEETVQAVASLSTKGATITRTTVIPVPHKRDLMAALFVRAARDLL